jgi:hypothetical protein
MIVIEEGILALTSEDDSLSLTAAEESCDQ